MTETTKMEAPESGVRLRMYNTGFGDCFLLAFKKQDGKPFYMMIDCGVHGQYKGGSNQIRKAVKEINKATGGHLDLIAVTHEHSDHVSGFYLARETFKNMNIEHAWMAWTENSEDPQARRLDKKKSLMLSGIKAAQTALALDGDHAAAEGIQNLIGFYEALNISTRESRDKVKAYIKANSPKYLEAKKRPQEIPGVDGVRVFVLGPPRDEEYLLRASPSKRNPEVYHGVHLRGEDSLAAALATASDTQMDDGTEERCMPFAGNHRISLEQVRCNPELYEFYHHHYGFIAGDENEWRRIDMDWQNSADSLALALDSATNNTSLVLAIELVHSKKVLLFAGDAQVGNWLSWHDGGWTDKEGLGQGEHITAEDLLHRTVLYKVGHHGSHNATLQEKGLEMMTSPDLIAMLPVDQKWAEARKPHPWKMPFKTMYEDLKVRTKNRILRTDTGIETPSARAQYDAAPKVVEDGNGNVLYVELQIFD